MSRFHSMSVRGVRVDSFRIQGFCDTKSLIRIELELANNALSASHDYRKSIPHLKNATKLFYLERESSSKLLNLDIPLEPAWVANIGHTSSLSTLVKLNRLGLADSSKFRVVFSKTPNIPYLNLFSDYFYIEKLSEVQVSLMECDPEFLFHPMAAIRVKEDFLDHYEAFNFAEFEFRNSAPNFAHIFDRNSIALQELRGRNTSILHLFTKPFVMFHVRESDSPISRSANNNPLKDYLPAMHYLAENGVRVIRMGDSTMTPLSRFGVSHELIFDYAHSNLKSNDADVLFWSNALFSVCTSSGPAWIPNDFGIPSLFTNAPHVGNMHGIRGFVIPQLLVSKEFSSLVPINEMLHNRFAWNNLNEDSEFARIRNTPQDIELGVRFMLDKTTSNCTDSDWFRTKEDVFAMPIERHFMEKLFELKLV